MKTEYVSITALERDIIRQAEDRLGLISSTEERFIRKIAKWPAHFRLSVDQANWLYDIGEKKLGMIFNRPARAQPIDYRARACA